jgi:hypothetical protein
VDSPIPDSCDSGFLQKRDIAKIQFGYISLLPPALDADKAGFKLTWIRVQLTFRLILASLLSM